MQIGFFISDSDKIDFIKYVVDQGDLTTDNLGNILTLEECSKSDYSPSYIILPESKIVMRDKFISDIKSEVIHFSGGKIDHNKNIYPGRLWIKMKYFDPNGNEIRKNIKLFEVYKKYVKWIKQHFKTKIENFYISDRVYQLAAKEDFLLREGPRMAIDLKEEKFLSDERFWLK